MLRLRVVCILHRNGVNDHRCVIFFLQALSIERTHQQQQDDAGRKIMKTWARLAMRNKTLVCWSGKPVSAGDSFRVKFQVFSEVENIMMVDRLADR